MSVVLLFPPSWTLATGSPHLATPLLTGFLRSNGIEVYSRDLNWDFVNSLGITLSAAAAQAACDDGTLDGMNQPYFAAEDALNQVVDKYNGQWNAQLGFESNAWSSSSSVEVLSAIDLPSPFSEFFSAVVIPQIMAVGPRLVGLCLACSQQVLPSLQLCRLLRQAGYQGFIVLGGNTISRLSREMADADIFHIVDGLITFQGELPLLTLYKTVICNGPLEQVPSLVWKTTSGAIMHNHASAPINPDLVPTPDYGDMAVGQYWGANYLNLIAARGCYFGKCTFCAIPYGWGSNGYSGTRSVDLVFDDMVACIEKYGIHRFKFVDEALSPAFMLALAERICSQRITVEWEGYVRCEHAWLDGSFVRRVAQSGFRKGYFGLEILPSARRSVLHKKDQPHPKRLVRNCGDFGVKVHFFCMFGYPGTGEEDARRTVEFLFDEQRRIDTADIFPWTYTKHTIVPGVEPIKAINRDWALEFPHRALTSDALPSELVCELASRWEDIVWQEVPRYLHPVYRLVSPWTGKVPTAAGTKSVVVSPVAAGAQK